MKQLRNQYRRGVEAGEINVSFRAWVRKQGKEAVVAEAHRTANQPAKRKTIKRVKAPPPPKAEKKAEKKGERRAA